MMGSRTEKNEKAVAWQKKSGAKATVGTFSQAAKFGELVFNCTQGVHSIEVLKSAGVDNLKSKILIDISNALDFSKGMPPTLAICNTESLAEKIQAEFPETKVVKTLNTINFRHMVQPQYKSGTPTMFMCGNNTSAKVHVRDLLQSLGWQDIQDVGTIERSRLLEPLCLLWVEYGVANETWDHAFSVIR
jgi:predicted dinucleotide-binding enzyme